MSQFGSDRVLLFNVTPWKELGFGAPNFGDNVGTLNLPIANLVDEIGRVQLSIMTHEDAARKQPPSINTVKRLCKTVNRVKTVLAGRQKSYNQQRLEAGHATPAPEVFNIHPVPYFSQKIVKNFWLREYNRLCMFALTNMMQHSDNKLPLTVTVDFSSTIWAYFAEMSRLIGTELLNISPDELADEKFQFKEEHFTNYSPDLLTINMEPLDSPGPIFNLPTEDDLGPLFQGIPANLIYPNLVQYPVSGPTDFSGTYPTEAQGGTAGASTATAAAVIGPPQL